MPITVTVDVGFALDVKAKASEAFALLSDVPTAASDIPKVDKLVDLGHGVYRWEMEKIGVGAVTLQTIYACKYVSNKAKGTVVWTPVEGEGNARMGGSWTIKGNKKATHLVLEIQGGITLPLPGLMQMVVAPVVESEFERMTGHYVANVAKRLGGEV